VIELLKDVGIVIGVVVALLGLIGGLISLPKKIKEFRNWLRPLGDRGTKYFLLGREDTDQYTNADFLVADDLMHFLKSFGKVGAGSTTLTVDKVGEFYRVKIQFPLGALDSLMKVKNR